MGKSGSIGGDALKDVVHERVHDAHGFAGDTSVRVNLLQHLVDVDGIAFLSLSPPLLLSIRWSLCFPALFSPFFPATLGAMSVDQNGSECPRLSQSLFITKSLGDQLTCGSKSLSFNWLFYFNVNMLSAYIIIFH